MRIIFFSLFFFIAVSVAGQKPIKVTQYHMGTAFSITIAENIAEQKIHAAIEQAFAEIKRLDGKYSTYQSQSFLSKLNRTAYKHPQPIDKETHELLSFAQQIQQQTMGVFDIAVEPLSTLWNFRQKPFKPPTDTAIKQLLKALGENAYRLTKTTLQFQHPLTQLSLNAYAKGYAVDNARDVLQQKGIKNFIVDGGGDIYISGKKFDQPWTVGIQDPNRRDAKAIKLIELTNKAIVTSGNYQQYAEYQGKRYSHILDPRTGYPAEHAKSVTVIADNTMLADALATVFMVLGEKEREVVRKRFSNVDVVVID